MTRTFVAVSVLAAVLLTPTAGVAQTPAPGIIREATRRESARLAALPAGLRQPQQPPQKRSWRSRHPVLFGTLIGVGAALAIEAVVIPGESGGEPHSVYVPMFGTFGAGIGAATGWIVSAVRR
jgi:hypothetical protein